MVAENSSASLRKISEIYDRIAFAGVGKFDEYENLRKSGVRYADFKGFSYCREDVAARNLANEYSTALGGIFTREMKPFEVEVLVAEVGHAHGESSFYRILFDGMIADYRRFVSIGGNTDALQKIIESGWSEELSLEDAVKLGVRALEDCGDGGESLDEKSLEIAVLDRNRTGRKFKRLEAEETRKLIGG